MFRNQLSEAERYAIAADQAYQTLERQPVRWGTMAVRGERAVPLLSVGAVLLSGEVRKGGEDGDVDHYDWCGDYVVGGAALSFHMLQTVLDPANRRIGIDGYQVIPCDAEGAELPTVKDVISEHFTEVARSQNFWLGEDREDYWRAAAMGIACAITSEHAGAQRIQKMAEKMANGSERMTYASRGLHIAAEQTLRTVLASQAAQSPDSPLSVYVRVEQLNGQTVLFGDMPFDNVVHIYGGTE
jgi:hypothetical protein